MSDIETLRKKFPQYQDKTDAELLYGVYNKFYSEMPVVGFAKKLGLDKTQAGDLLVEANKAGKPFGFTNKDKPEVGGGFLGTVRGLFQGGTIGTGDEIIAGGTAGLKKIVSGDDRPLGDIYQQELQRERERIGEFKETDPIKAYGSEFIGGAAVPFGAAKNLKQAATLGGVTGGLYAAGTSEGDMMDRLMAMPTGVALGSILGGTFQVAGRTVSDVFKDFLTKKAQQAAAQGAKSVEELKQSANNLYKLAENSGVQIDPVGLNKIIDDVLEEVGTSGRPLSKTLFPKSKGVLQEIEAAAKDFASDITKSAGMKDIDFLSKLTQAPKSDFTNNAERRVGGIISDAIDNYVAKLTPDQLISGDPANAMRTLKEAQKTWSVMSKTRVINDLLEAAPNYAGGLESGLKNQIRTLLNNPKKRKQFNKEELTLLAQIQQGTPLGNLIANISQAGFSMTGGRNPLSGGVATGAMGVSSAAGALVGGPVGALVAPLITGAATTGLRYVREMSMKNRVELFQAIVSNGLAEQVKTANPSAFRALEAATRSFTSGATKGTIAAGADQTQYAVDKMVN